MDDSKGEIYKVTCHVTGMSYIGQARCYVGKTKKAHGAKGRWKAHVWKAVHSPQHFADTTIWAAIKLYGETAFSVEVIEMCDVDDLNDKERFFIKHFDTQLPHGYNKLSGHHRIFGNKQWSSEQRINISRVHKNTMTDLPMYMVYVKARPDCYLSEGFAIINHPQSRAKYFTSKKHSLDEKYQFAIEYLNNLN